MNHSSFHLSLFGVLVLTSLFAKVLGQSSAPTTRPNGEEWQNETLLHAGTEPPAATMAIFPDEAAAKALRRDKSPFFQSRDGEWKYAWVPKPADRIAEFFKTEFNDSAWK